ncbi:signal peptidase I [Evansella vedderi]|uniref:Signal peptidase I n=1 Tax=Evansella vedderi TaxID=38282 RepID=A0ABU0A0J4_9BACI|nr:signal peptidase I [Evansella vedderi]MDQ0257012.1 signal peptidase I [Evansella vedderi]
MEMEGQVYESEVENKINWKKEIWSWTKTFIVVILVVSIVRGFFFTNYIVYGQSMMPTIEDGERIIVNKIGYEMNEPDRFDLIIFHATQDTDYIKRVIGLPGDTIEYKDDVLYVNDVAVREEFLASHRDAYTTGLFTENFTLESVTGSSIVPEDHVFVLGDNRRNSIDSRHIGFVEFKEIVGKANLAYWPPKNLRIFN